MWFIAAYLEKVESLKIRPARRRVNNNGDAGHRSIFVGPNSRMIRLFHLIGFLDSGPYSRGMCSLCCFLLFDVQAAFIVVRRVC